ncbi:MAG: 3'-5' exonuclease [Bacteroidia bacterium]
MLTDTELKHILFLDIETAPLVYNYNELAPEMKALWNKKWQFNKEITPEQQYAKAGIYAEFAKVICISTGMFNGGKFEVSSFCGDDEKLLLAQFSESLSKSLNKKQQILCAHNGKEFDFPFICRRLLINGLPLPNALNIAGKKPWDIQHLDTMELWKFGDYKNYTSLNLLAAIFNIPTPKDEIEGSDVARVYYEEKNLEKIKRYCCKDVVTVARIVQKYKGMEMLSDSRISYIENNKNLTLA